MIQHGKSLNEKWISIMALLHILVMACQIFMFRENMIISRAMTSYDHTDISKFHSSWKFFKLFGSFVLWYIILHMNSNPCISLTIFEVGIMQDYLSIWIVVQRSKLFCELAIFWSRYPNWQLLNLRKKLQFSNSFRARD